MSIQAIHLVAFCNKKAPGKGAIAQISIAIIHDRESIPTLFAHPLCV